MDGKGTLSSHAQGGAGDVIDGHQLHAPQSDAHFTPAGQLQGLLCAANEWENNENERDGICAAA